MFENPLQIDARYLRDDGTLKGYVFVPFISLNAFDHKILILLEEEKINARVSVKGALLQMSKIYPTNVEDRTIMAGLPRKVEELDQTMDLEPELFHERLRAKVRSFFK